MRSSRGQRSRGHDEGRKATRHPEAGDQPRGSHRDVGGRFLTSAAGPRALPDDDIQVAATAAARKPFVRAFDAALASK